MYFNGQEAAFQISRLGDFARLISGPIGLPVFDKTGLTAEVLDVFVIEHAEKPITD